MTDKNQILLDISARLSTVGEAESKLTPCGTGQYPSVESLTCITDLIRTIFFPDFFGNQGQNPTMRKYLIGVKVENLFNALRQEIAHALKFNDVCRRDEAEMQAAVLSSGFIEKMPDIKKLIYSDVEAIYKSDPAVTDYGEIVLCYPAITAMLNYRVAHALLGLDVPVIPRMLTEIAHSRTGIDINPGAKIGAYFAIDHGTGIVIGQTAIIGRHCTLYQGVTLGAKSFVADDDGMLLNIPRHPILEDNVTVYSNASILGRITVGHDTVIGGNVWLTQSVPPFSRILQRRAVTTQTFTDGAGI